LDPLLDFRDLDSGTDDLIAMRERGQAVMTMTQVENGVLLALGAKASLLLPGVTVGPLGQDDFGFKLGALFGSDQACDRLAGGRR
jgi:hypothetical protein